MAGRRPPKDDSHRPSEAAALAQAAFAGGVGAHRHARQPHRSVAVPGGDAESHPRTRRKAPMKIIAILLIVAGALALAYGGFSYTRDKTAVKLGPLELSVKEKETV